MLNGKVVVVTGGSGYLGRNFVSAVAHSGGVAISADIDEDAGRAQMDDLAALGLGERTAFFACDATSAGSIESIITQTTERFGCVDALVNNAYPRNPRYGRKMEEVTYEDFVDNMGRHVGGYFLAAQRFIRAFRAQEHGGTIINMGSIYGVVAPRFEIYDHTSMTMPVEYSAIKSAIIHLTRYLAQYTKGEGIRVNALSPGGVVDEQPARFLERYRNYASDKGMLDPSDLNGTLLFLLSDAARYINGQNIIVDDGWSL